MKCRARSGITSAVMAKPGSAGKLLGTVRVPASKPHCQRAVLLASLAAGRSEIHNFADCTETSIIAKSCGGFGARYRSDAHQVTIDGFDGMPNPAQQVLRTAGSGFALRTLLAVSCLVAAPTVFVSNERMSHRPIRPLLGALAAQGSTFEPLDPAEPLPLVSFGGGLRGGTISVASDQTSQFVTALMLVAPYGASPLTLELAAPPVGGHYIRMTVDLMRQFGAVVNASEDLSTLRVQPGGYRASGVSVGVDVNAFFYFVAAAVVADADIRVREVRLGVDAFLDAAVSIGRRLGVVIEQDGSDVRISSGEPPTARVYLDAVDVPTLVPALAAVASSLPAGMELTGAAHLVYHKTSRLDLTIEGLAAMGRHLEPVYTDGQLAGFRTQRLGPPSAAVVDSHGDHRLFMALFLASLSLEESVHITGADTLTASFPAFLPTFESLRALTAVAV